VALRTVALRTVALRTVALRTVALRTVALRTVALKTVALRTVALRTGAACLAACLACCLAGCGAKTGLDVPDASRQRTLDAGRDAGVPCFEVPFDGGVLDVPLELEAQLGRADVLFLVDTTASMGDEITQIRAGLRDRIAPGIADAIPDSELGVASFEDFPAEDCGDTSDAPFRLLTPITDDLNRVQAAVDALRLGNGLDRPESQVEALYQTATGEGLGRYIPPSFGCPGGGIGYPCFRSDALPIVLLFTDAPFHDGPGGTNPYLCSVTPRPHSYSQAVDVLNRLGIRVIGLYSGDDGLGRPDLFAIARDTESVDGPTPLVFDIGSRAQRLSEEVVGAIRTLADVIQFDVDAVLIDPNPTDGVDPRDFVDALIPVRADPMDRIERIDTTTGTFVGVRAGTRITYQLRVRNDAVVPGSEPQRFEIEVLFRGDGRARLGSRTVEIVVPAADGSGCEGG
jgi:hypothetical protein